MRGARYVHTILAFGIVLAPLTCSAAANDLRVFIADAADQYWGYIVDTASGSATLLSTGKTPPGSRSRMDYGALLQAVHARNVQRSFAVAQLSPAARANVNWATLSPDCRYVVAGPERAEFDLLERLTLARADPWEIITRVPVSTTGFVKDLGWSADSRYVVVIETVQSPGIGIGHPAPHDKLTAVVLAVETGVVRRIELTQKARGAAVIVEGDVAKCPFR